MQTLAETADLKETIAAMTELVRSRSSAESSTQTTQSTQEDPSRSDVVYTWDGPDGAALSSGLAIIKARPCIGLLFSGKPGNGKTTAALQHAGKGAWFWDCGDSDQECRRFIIGDDRYVTLANGRNAIIDDLGAEEPWNEYGTKHEPLGEWLWGLHKRWLRGDWRGRLFITTNLTGKEMAARYGGALVSRLLEMCVPVRFTGRSLRAAAGRPLEPAERQSAEEDAEAASAPSSELPCQAIGIPAIAAV